ncbi:hypothetical protein CROQUDRAFT_689271 [Cronartium quercuum f. sp. fusiforme G11]|uniref:Uncharacterized protein n=1 Tax=Cronartium quercuum f. sp. fusiforme G11 TaxID=708437 RepID=A0A9P6TEU7_9BASI|nr:hypothetical protein CROQUDRAFT_689271 [Cronartium quercuum f. sp. fusiforme G11]
MGGIFWFKMNQRRLEGRKSTLFLLLSNTFVNGQPITQLDEGDVLYTTTKTTVISKTQVVKSKDAQNTIRPENRDPAPENENTIRPDNIVGVVFGSVAIFIANAMLLMLYLRKRRRRRQEEGKTPKKLEKKDKQGNLLSKAFRNSFKRQERQEDGEILSNNRVSGLGRLFGNRKSQDPKDNTEFDNLASKAHEKTKPKRKSKGKSKLSVSTGVADGAAGPAEEAKPGFFGRFFENPTQDKATEADNEHTAEASKDPEVTLESTSKSEVTEIATKPEGRSFFGIFRSKSTKPSRQDDESEKKEGTVKDSSIRSPSGKKLGFFKALSKKPSIHIVTDLETDLSTEKKDSASNKLASKALSPIKRKSSKDSKRKTSLKDPSSTDKKDVTEVESTVESEKRKNATARMSKKVLSPVKRRGSKVSSKQTVNDTVTSPKDTVNSPQKFKAVLQKFQKVVEANKNQDQPVSSEIKKEGEGE